ncbi:L-lactate dehydrogenase [Thermoanaerobacter sp. CM-CNRG TB177]|jgi:L-lactate dehydrogenase|uniref:L-lactate dehydrogenase n=3 Tax=Thermoanaerobacter TaxID=1754 RepID=LDH_THEP3|nr:MULTISPECIES: L-lactate dehydrogenase [Thermoanaerobacter]B0K226.1 RecName: Full=L-lactate dehydrogenase; Short=L-LDH [Thermoanaerobacter sp. X514]B0KDA4.1 RecName: Full=L-lactate dehydrogenase; Short=L-LDH [Thermoanaerobacter pseudethanolicus ATCC 33223]ABY91534.1 L-lactate dehydrogenase [Thermoanaerobacter sp. X514]ABY95623.1 L-lactate dehydrogenase [Thermoanaerobacter pseudethanolicus ATCC 33223]ADV80561.1 L-lactate dehydrogenase [Thermoanaerobacter brockii subsp. finnii Ako-1]MBT128018
MNKISIIGSGFVGATTAYTLALSGIAKTIVLIDINKDKAEGDALDISHGVPFISPVELYAGDYSDVSGSDIIIITAGAAQKPGETRLDLVKRNTMIFKDIVAKLIKVNDTAIYLIVTNPVDILTYVTYKISGLPYGRVLGSGTVLDSARFRYLLSKHCNIDPRNIHGYIIGEHGDSELAAWSITNIAGIPIDNYCNLCGKACEKDFREEIFNNVVRAAYTIIEKKGATYYAVALAVRRIVEAIFRDENSILTVSSPLTGQYGVTNVALSLPSVVGRNGIVNILELPLSQEEIAAFRRSAEVIKSVIQELDI